jgi:hypothetical protein
MHLDITLVETGIHYTTGSSLLGDGVRVLTRTMKRIAEIASRAGTRLLYRTPRHRGGDRRQRKDVNRDANRKTAPTRRMSAVRSRQRAPFQTKLFNASQHPVAIGGTGVITA